MRQFFYWHAGNDKPSRSLCAHQIRDGAQVIDGFGDVFMSADVAELVGVPSQALRDWVRHGHIERKNPGRHPRYSGWDLLNILLMRSLSLSGVQLSDAKPIAKRVVEDFRAAAREGQAVRRWFHFTPDGNSAVADCLSPASFGEHCGCVGGVLDLHGFFLFVLQYVKGQMVR